MKAEKKKYNVDSFNLDHTKVKAPFVRLAGKKLGEHGDIVSKYDIRFTQPNVDFLSNGTIHSLEHLIAEYIRDEMPGVIDFSPMGCRTGFYFTVFGDYEEAVIAKHLVAVLKKVADWSAEVPATTAIECGHYKEHDLEGAKLAAKNWVEGIEKDGWSCYK